MARSLLCQQSGIEIVDAYEQGMYNSYEQGKSAEMSLFQFTAPEAEIWSSDIALIMFCPIWTLWYACTTEQSFTLTSIRIFSVLLRYPGVNEETTPPAGQEPFVRVVTIIRKLESPASATCARF